MPSTTQACGPHTDVYMARSIRKGWHVEGVGIVDYVSTPYAGGTVTLGGPQGYRSFRLDAFIEALPPLLRSFAQSPSPSYLGMLATEYSTVPERVITARPAAKPSAAETPGTIANVQAFGWS